MILSLADLGAAVLAGAAIGIFYFGGLLLTVRKVKTARRAGKLLAVSFVLRTGITALAFVLVMAGSWERLLSCLLGFLVARGLLSRWCLARSPGFDRVLGGTGGR